MQVRGGAGGRFEWVFAEPAALCCSFVLNTCTPCVAASQAELQQIEVATSIWERSGTNCCTARDWVRQRKIASLRAVLDYKQQYIVQVGHRSGAVFRMGRLLL